MKALSLLVFILTSFYLDSTVATTSDARELLLSAVQRGNVGQVKVLLSGYPSGPLSEEDVGSALIDAASEGYLEIVKLFLNSEAELNFLNKHSQAVVRRSAQVGHVEVIRYLIELQGDSDVADKLGRTALMMFPLKAMLMYFNV